MEISHRGKNPRRRRRRCRLSSFLEQLLPDGLLDGFDEVEMQNIMAEPKSEGMKKMVTVIAVVMSIGSKALKPLQPDLPSLKMQGTKKKRRGNLYQAPAYTFCAHCT
uniref:Uncharacterized protein n=1 Tax=Oryza glumipatula TaxID=40148 RepID=A0A0D9YQJ8_9ORYZ